MSSERTRRRLSAAERDLWRKVVADATPLKRPTVPEAKSAPELPAPEAENPRNGTRLPADFRIGLHAELPAATALAGPTERDGPRMDAKTQSRIRRGKVTPEARLDLHGMTIADAQPTLTRFILRAQSSGKRLVLVITGKGKHSDDGGPIPTRFGVLRREVPIWLRSGVLAGAVLNVTQAHQRHGGSGACYVFLRRLR